MVRVSSRLAALVIAMLVLASTEPASADEATKEKPAACETAEQIAARFAAAGAVQARAEHLCVHHVPGFRGVKLLGQRKNGVCEWYDDGPMVDCADYKSFMTPAPEILRRAGWPKSSPAERRALARAYVERIVFGVGGAARFNLSKITSVKSVGRGVEVTARIGPDQNRGYHDAVYVFSATGSLRTR